MNIYIIGILASVVGFFLVIVFRKRMRGRQLLFWILLWAAVGVLSAFPEAIDFLKNLFAVGYRAYFVFTLAIVGLLLMNLYIFTLINGIYDQIAKLAQEFALFRYEVEKRKSRDDTHEGGSDHNSSQ